MYALGYLFLISMLSMFMNSLCMALHVLAIYEPGQVIQTQDFFFGGVANSFFFGGGQLLL